MNRTDKCHQDANSPVNLSTGITPCWQLGEGYTKVVKALWACVVLTQAQIEASGLWSPTLIAQRGPGIGRSKQIAVYSTVPG